MMTHPYLLLILIITVVIREILHKSTHFQYTNYQVILLFHVKIVLHSLEKLQTADQR